MAEWIPVGSNIVRGDIVRWRLTIWGAPPKKGSSRGSSVKLGELWVTTQFVEGADDEGYVWMTVLECEELWKSAGEIPPPPRKGSRLTRKIKTIIDGKPERMKWESESAREAVLSERG